MLGILILIELASSCLLLSAIEWLRHLSGRSSPRSAEVRYLLPILAPIAFVLLLSYQIARPLPTTTTNVVILLVVSIAFVALVLFLLTELARYHTRPQGSHRPSRYRHHRRKAQ